MDLLATALARLVASNNRRVAAADGTPPGLRRVADLEWHRRLSARVEVIGGEWDRFEAAGGRLPAIESVIAEGQGNEGTWRVGLLVAAGTPVARLADRFPATVAALAEVPGLRSAMWSVLEPGARLPPHRGPNAGVLRYHLGVRCPPGAELEVGGRVVPYEDGGGLLFDDTQLHAAWNGGAERRVTIFCELLRPLPVTTQVANRVVQRVIALDPRFRLAGARANEWDLALNPT